MIARLNAAFSRWLTDRMLARVTLLEVGPRDALLVTLKKPASEITAHDLGALHRNQQALQRRLGIPVILGDTTAELTVIRKTDE